MAKYRITDPDTGQAYMVTGDGTQEEAMQEFMDHQAGQQSSQPVDNQAQTQLASQAVMEKRLADEATAKEAAKEAGLDPLTRLSHFIDKKIGTPKFITDSADSATDYFPPANALKAGLSALSGQNIPQASRIMAQGLPIFGHMIPDDAETPQYRKDNQAKSAIMKGEGYAVPALALAALTGGSSMPILAGGAAQGGMAGLDERSRQINENTENRPDDMRNVALNTAATPPVTRCCASQHR